MALGLIIGIIEPNARVEYAMYTANLDGLAQLQHAVRGLIEYVPCHGSVDIICNEEGRIHGLPVNIPANHFFETVDSYGILDAGQPLVGDIVIFGPTDADGNSTDVPDFVLKAFDL